MTADEAMMLGNPRAKMLVHLMAERAMRCDGAKGKVRSPYRDVYDAAKAAYVDREGWTPGHQHNAALRLVGKRILLDIWRVSHADHGFPTPVSPASVPSPDPAASVDGAGEADASLRGGASADRTEGAA